MRKWGICVPQQTVHCTCIFTFPSSNLILNVENDTPIVGAISQGSISSMYCLMRLLLPTPEITEKKARRWTTSKLCFGLENANFIFKIRFRSRYAYGYRFHIFHVSPWCNTITGCILDRFKICTNSLCFAHSSAFINAKRFHMVYCVFNSNWTN